MDRDHKRAQDFAGGEGNSVLSHISRIGTSCGVADLDAVEDTKGRTDEYREMDKYIVQSRQENKMT